MRRQGEAARRRVVIIPRWPQIVLHDRGDGGEWPPHDRQFCRRPAGWAGYAAAMAKKTETELVVDLRGRSIETIDDFWDAVAAPCGLPKWFGRNTEAWRDSIHTRGISEVIDSYDVLVIHVDKQGVFAAQNSEARALRSAFAGRRSRLVVHEVT